MSFLNPVNEPVLRFSSTDTDAPQINYNARVAGDVKAVLKACLVTGYGAKASAGWSIANEVDHVAEFVSPSTAMGDYRLSINDTSTASTIWDYFYQNNKVSPTGNTTSKNASGINKTSSSNRWDLIVTNQGFYFIETVMNTAVNAVGSSVVYFGRIKSGIDTTSTSNIAWWCLGFGSADGEGRPTDFFSAQPNSTGQKVTLASSGINSHTHIDKAMISEYPSSNIQSSNYLELCGSWWYSSNNQIIAQQPGVLLKSKITTEMVFSDYKSSLESRPVLYVWPIRGTSNASFLYRASRVVVIIYLDYWDY